MVPAQVKDPLSQFLKEVESSYASRFPNEHIHCQKILVEDHYEVDTRYSVYECLSDMMKVFVIASLKTSNDQNINNTHNNNNNIPNHENKHINGKAAKNEIKKDK